MNQSWTITMDEVPYKDEWLCLVDAVKAAAALARTYPGTHVNVGVYYPVWSDA